MTERVDVVVVGGGPAGATAAALLAKAGHRTLLLEKEKFPRYHIGESTVPGILPVLKELGILEEVETYGFILKQGITLVWGSQRGPWSVNFAESGRGIRQYDHAFQFVRSQFDALLLNTARRSGATVLEEATVTDFLFEQGRCGGLKYTLGPGSEPQTVSARFIVDASGQSALLGRKERLLEWDEALRNVAIWAYYQGGKTYEGWRAGNILVENLPEGWLWTIPLHDHTFSVGLVRPASVAGGRKALEEQLERTIAGADESQQLLATARRVSDFRAARDWSYVCKRMAGPGFLLTGDAAGFVDPLFSTGVFLALRGGSLAAATVDRVLREPDNAGELLARYEESYREFFNVVISFVHFFYDASRARERYFERAQQLIDPIGVMEARQDFVQLITGMAGIRPVMRLDP